MNLVTLISEFITLLIFLRLLCLERIMYDKISRDWNRKRKYPWKPFVKYAEKAMKIWMKKFNHSEKGIQFIDLGAGSGRNATFFHNFSTRLIEVDISFNMLRINDSKSIKVHCSMQQLPFRDNSFDGVFAVASIHHITGHVNRQNTIKEINRIGKMNALIGLTVWRFYQKKFIKQFIEQLSKPKDTKKHGEIGDVYVPWTISQGKQHQTIQRFYHLFRIHEFNQLIAFIPY